MLPGLVSRFVESPISLGVNPTVTSHRLKLALLGDADHINTQRWNAGLQAAGAETIMLALNSAHSRPRTDTIRLPTIRQLGRLNYVLAAPFARRFLKRWQPDVVLAYYVTGYGTLGRLCGIHPLVQITSGSDVLLAPNNRFMRSLVNRNLRAADLVTAWAPHLADAARSLGAKNVFVLPAGIILDVFRSHRVPKPKTDDPPRLIITRGLKAYYRIDLLIETMRILREREVPFVLTIAGTGPERETLENLMRRYNLQDQIRFAGFVPNHVLPALLAQHNMYISLVPSDGVSASLLEAMAVGLLPFVPNHPANTDWIVHEKNGYIIDDISAGAIATMIEHNSHVVRHRAWEQNPLIISERADLYRNAWRYVKQFQQLIRSL
jgi:glycosyltransferase involved in cell wall biosynthesis